MSTTDDTRSMKDEDVNHVNVINKNSVPRTLSLACQALTPAFKLEPLKLSQLPNIPWCEILTDFHGPLPLLVIFPFSNRSYYENYNYGCCY